MKNYDSMKRLKAITAGTGIIEGVLQMASESLGGFMRS